MRTAVISAGHYLPEEVLTNQFFIDRNPLYEMDEYENRGKEIITTDEWIQQMTGIKERRCAAHGEEVHDMGARAVMNALEKAQKKPTDLEGIIVATVTQNKQFPSAACFIQELSGARNAQRVFDIGAACAGFTTAIDIAHQYIQNGSGPFAVVGVEKLSRMVDYKDKNAPLFGDGAGAVILEQTESAERGIMDTRSRPNPFEDRTRWIYRDHRGYMRMPYGKEVLKDAIRELAEITQEMTGALRTPSGQKWDDPGMLDLAVFHQANIRILQGVQKRLRLVDGQVMRNIERYGNMSSASAAVALSEAYEQGKIKEGSRVIMACIGSGMVTSAVAFVA